MENSIDLTNKTFSKITVKCFAYKKQTDYWECICTCGNTKIFNSHSLLSGHNKSCGECRKHNVYLMNENIIIGALDNGENFIFDVDDFELVRFYKWYMNEEGYIYSLVNKKKVYIYRIIMGLNSYIEDRISVDHINHNKKDNRKENLRLATKTENKRNGTVRKDNQSGIIGVRWYKKSEKWNSFIAVNKKDFNLGYYDDIQDAIVSRLKTEKEYFGEFAPQRQLFEEYGII